MKHKHHIIPRHMNGTDHPSNIAHLTPEEHAKAHKQLWEQDGRWQDYCAWQGLAKLSTGKEHHWLVMSEKSKASWKDPEVRAKRIVGIKKARGHDTIGCKKYKVTMPDGKIRTVNNLKKFCTEQYLNYNSFWNATVGHSRQHKGYKAQLTF